MPRRFWLPVVFAVAWVVAFGALYALVAGACGEMAPQVCKPTDSLCNDVGCSFSVSEIVSQATVAALVVTGIAWHVAWLYRLPVRW